MSQEQLLSEIARLRAENEQLRCQPQPASASNSDFHQSPGDFQLSASPRHHTEKYGNANNSTPRSARPQTAMAGPLTVGQSRSPMAQTHRQPDRAQDRQHPMKRAKTIQDPRIAAPIQRSASAAAATKMGRSSSSRSATVKSSPLGPARAGPGPRPRAPSLPGPPSRMDPSMPNPMLADYVNQCPMGQPPSSFLYADSFNNVMPQQRPSLPLASLVEHGKEYNPGDYLAMLNPHGMMEDELSSNATVMPMSISMPAPTFGSSSMYANPAYCHSGLPSLSSTPTVETPMSRQNSQLFPDLAANMDMVRINSQQSTHGQQDYMGHQSQFISPDSMFSKGPDADLMGMGANLVDPRYHPASFDPRQHPQYTATAMVPSVSQRSMLSTSSSIVWETDHKAATTPTEMERSDSNQSSKSLKERAKEALQRQCANAKVTRSLQPKPILAIKQEPSEPQTTSAKVKDGKTQITKTSSYTRPKHPKVFCQQCKEVPDGFRGEHELRRHTEAKHKSVVKRYICVEPETEPPIKAFKSLADCKQCTQQKHYGAYYNAAAHLRRTHFKPKANRKATKTNTKKNGATDVSSAPIPTDEKRGGKGGGDWPPMRVLKMFMKSITVPMESAGAFDAEEGMDDPNDMEDPGDLDPPLPIPFVDQANYDLPLSHIGSAFAMDEGAYTTAMMSNTTSAMMPDLSAYGAMDPAMFLDAQANFDQSSMIAEFQSPVSSTDTITPDMGGHYQMQGSQNMAASGDFQEMSFDLAFQMPQI